MKPTETIATHLTDPAVIPAPDSNVTVAMTRVSPAVDSAPSTAVAVRNKGGRPKGVPNKRTKETVALMSGLLSPKYYANLKKRLENGECAPAVEQTVLHYAHGKPIERVEHSGVSFAELVLASIRVTAEGGEK
jgi:hypothetical protein